MADFMNEKSPSASYESSPEVTASLFGSWLRECRKAMGMTQEELAHEVGISRNYLSQIERGRRENVSWGVQERLEAYFERTYTSQPEEDPTVAMGQFELSQRSAATKSPKEEARVLGQEVRARRMTDGVSQEDLAKQVGVSRSYLSQIERGLRRSFAARIRRRLMTFVILGTARDLQTEGKAIDLPVSLSVFARRAELSLDEISVLAQIRYQGRQPDTPEKWETLYNAIKSICTE